MKLIDIKVIVFILFSQLMFSQAAIRTSKPSTKFLIENEDIETQEAFRAKSIAKVQDLYNYLNIIGNTDFDSDIRTHTASLVLNLFSEKATINNILSSSKEQIFIKRFLKILLQSKEKIQFSIAEVNLPSILLVYSLTIKKGTAVSSMKMVQTIYWNYETKQFGSHSKKVLTSSLGSISIL